MYTVKIMVDTEKSNVSLIVGFWTGVAIWIVIMTAFGWWRVWWAYFPLIGVVSGAIQRTANLLHNQRKIQTQPIQSDISQPSRQYGEETQENLKPIRNHIKCPGCGNLLEDPNLKFCPTCGTQLE